MSTEQAQLILEKLNHNTELKLQIHQHLLTGFGEVIAKINRVEVKHAAKA